MEELVFTFYDVEINGLRLVLVNANVKSQISVYATEKELFPFALDTNKCFGRF